MIADDIQVNHEPAAEKPQQFWAFEVINFDLLRDDLSSADCIGSWRVYPSRAIAEHYVAEYMTEWCKDCYEGDEDELEAPVFSPSDISWSEEHVDMFKFFFEEAGEVIVLHPVEVKGL